MTPRKQTKKEIEHKTEDGFDRMKVTLNLSMPCWTCKKKPNEFYWKPKPGTLTEIYCIGCKRG